MATLEIMHLLLNLQLLFCFYYICCVSTKEDNGYCSKDGCPQQEVKFDQSSLKLHFFENDVAYMNVYLPEILKSDVMEYCDSTTNDRQVKLCVNWKRYGKLIVKRAADVADYCHNVFWEALSLDFAPVDCIALDGANWYGGAELNTQKWPLQDFNIPLQPYISQDAFPLPKSYGNVLEPYWINSNGVGVIVSDDVPLHVGSNENGSNRLCLKAAFVEPHFQPQHGQLYPSLNYTICKSNNVRSVHQLMYNRFFDKPADVPDTRMIKSPIWSTWARYKTLIDQSKVLEYAEEILHHNFTISQLEIDDMFSTHYGEFDFDTTKFPDASGMIKTLKIKGFRVTAWITPFANLDSEAFKFGMEKGYWLKDKQELTPSLVSWWQGVGAILDVTNPEAVEWYVSRLEKMKQEYGIDSFKFDAGEMTFMPSSYKTQTRLENPNMFTKLYVDAVSRLGNMIEVRCGYKSQMYPVFVRMADKDSKWGPENGLRALIPVALTMGILGYPFILPDMIGGNGYGEVLGTDAILPERELYIRWLQVTTYMSSMQFSFVPWQYDREVIDIARNMVEIHETVVTPILLKAAQETVKTGTPLIRPLWWIAPDDTQAQTIDSEFMVGNEILVAPILNKGARQRDIYLPAGKWKNDLTGMEIEGGQWIRNIKADLSQIPTFTVVK